MRRFVVPAVIAAAAVALLIVLASGVFDGGPNNSIAYSVQSHHYKAPPRDDAELPVLGASASRTQSFAAFRGKVVLVNFFASWCPPCQTEAPVLAKAETMLAAHGGTVLGIAFQNNPSQALGYLHQYDLGYPAVSDPGSNVANAFGISEVPDTYLINRQGKIVWLNLFQLTPGFLKTTLPKLISQYA